MSKIKDSLKERSMEMYYRNAKENSELKYRVRDLEGFDKFVQDKMLREGDDAVVLKDKFRQMEGEISRHHQIFYLTKERLEIEPGKVFLCLP